MHRLTTVGIFHTATGLIALAVGFWALARDREISPRNNLGRVFVGTMLLSSATALGIYRHGGFGPAHVLAVLTLLALAVGTASSLASPFARMSRYLQAVCFSSTILFAVVPGVTEVLMRFPENAPLVPFSEPSALKPVYGSLLLVFLAGLAFQLRRLRRELARDASGSTRR
jgi:uncharacterized membrane protein